MISAELKGSLVNIKVKGETGVVLNELIRLTTVMLTKSMKDGLKPEEIEEMLDSYGEMIKNEVLARLEKLPSGEVTVDGIIIDLSDKKEKRRHEDDIC